MAEKINSIVDAEMKYKQALKNYHKKSNRHVLVRESNIKEEQKRIISFLRMKNETGQNFTVMRF